MAIVIKKRIALDFLGEEYKEGYLVFRSVPIKNYPEIIKKAEGAENNLKSLEIILEILNEYFVEGKFPGKDGLENVETSDLQEFDQETILVVFETLIGKADPK